jgi:hypothetical protein
MTEADVMLPEVREIFIGLISITAFILFAILLALASSVGMGRRNGRDET